MQKLIKVITSLFAILFLLSSYSVYAKKSKSKILRYPIGCVAIGFKFDHFKLILKPTAKLHPQAIYFIHNLSGRSVTLLQARTGEQPYVIHINNTIHPKGWGVYATDEKVSKFICTNKAPKNLHDKVIDCGKVLDVCEFPYVKFGGNNRGNYWVVSSIGTHKAAVRAIVYHGILLRRVVKSESEKNKRVKQ